MEIRIRKYGEVTNRMNFNNLPNGYCERPREGMGSKAGEGRGVRHHTRGKLADTLAFAGRTGPGLRGKGELGPLGPSL